MSGDETIGLVVFAHGSRVTAANDAVRVVACEAARLAGISAFRTAFLELAAPTLAEAVADLSSEGIRRVLVTPYFLTKGRHLVEDLPRLLQGARSEHPELTIDASPPLDGHPHLGRILADRARALMEARTPATKSSAGSALSGLGKP